MANIGEILLEKEILLESGTNELEILVFRVADCTFGINVAKVREVLPKKSVDIVSLPKTHKSVIGVFTLREAVVPCVSLHTHLDLPSESDEDETTLIITDFNDHHTAFVVDEIERIHRVSWENVMAVPDLGALENTPMTATTQIDERLVIMLDFEMISDQVNQQAFRTDMVANPQGLNRQELKLVLADDSATVRQTVAATLRASGYTNLKIFRNGGQAWEWIDARFRETGDLSEVADLLISDVEMPQMDGFHLTRRIKEHPQLKRLPVLLYSSIVSPDNHKKGRAVGADAQVSKPDLVKVVELADSLILNGRIGEVTPVDQAVETIPPSTLSETAVSDATQRVVSENVILEVPEEAVDSNTSEDVKTELPEIEAESLKVQSDLWEEDPSLRDAENTPAPKFVNHSRQDADPQLWLTFQNELAGRVDQLRELCRQADDENCVEETINNARRTLHTIKSAAMVVPLDEVTQLTHLIEDLLEITSRATDRLPSERLSRYADLLSNIATQSCDADEVNAALSACQRMKSEINSEIETLKE